MKLAENLKRYREHNQLTQDAVAQEVRIARQSVSKWETGETYPSIDNLIIISRLFNVSIDELIMGEKFLQFPFEVGKQGGRSVLKRPLLMGGLFAYVMLSLTSSFWWTLFSTLLFVLFLLILVYTYPIDLIFQYWVIDKEQLLYLAPVQTYGEKFKRLFRYIRNKPDPLTALTYQEIVTVELVYEKKIIDVARTSLTSYNLSPFFMFSMRDPFYFLITTISGEKIKLDLTVDYYYHQHGYTYLAEIITFFSNKHIPVTDPQAILAIQQNDYHLYDYLYHGEKIKRHTS